MKKLQLTFQAKSGKKNNLSLNYVKENLDAPQPKQRWRRSSLASYFKKTISRFLMKLWALSISNVQKILFWDRFSKIHTIVIFLYKLIIEIIK